MWAIRRASTNSLKAPGLNIAALRACTGLGPIGIHKEDKSIAFEPHSITLDRWISSESCNCVVPLPTQLSVGFRCLSSQAGSKSGVEENDDLEDGFSELETPEDSERIKADVTDGDSTSDSDHESNLSSPDGSLEEALETDLQGDTEEDAGKTDSVGKFDSSVLTKLVSKVSSQSMSDALNNYFEDKEINRLEIYRVLSNLRRSKRFGKALQLSEWLYGREDFDFSERDYGSMVDLLAKVRGLQKAESYLDDIPKSFRGEVVHRTLLANYVAARLLNKSEQLFNKMKDLGFPNTVFTFNQMLFLYKRTEKRKIADVLLMMEKENIKPSVFTYQLLIDIKGQSNDIHGMEQIVESMKAEGVEPDIRVLAVLARHYALVGLKEKANAVLQEMKVNDLESNRFLCPIILPIYAILGNSEDVERIWKLVESSSSPKPVDFISLIDAFGKLKNVKQAEAIFDKMTQMYQKISSSHYTTMLHVYTENKMLSKGKDLLKRMGDAGCPIGPVAWDALIRLYVDAGEVEKADSVLKKAVLQNRQLRPLFSSYMKILYGYSKRGDVHNAEKIFERMRLAGYVGRPSPFQALIQTYINAKVPAYGIRERMKADNLYPQKALSEALALVDPFRKTAVSELLE